MLVEHGSVAKALPLVRTTGVWTQPASAPAQRRDDTGTYRAIPRDNILTCDGAAVVDQVASYAADAIFDPPEDRPTAAPVLASRRANAGYTTLPHLEAAMARAREETEHARERADEDFAADKARAAERERAKKAQAARVDHAWEAGLRNDNSYYVDNLKAWLHVNGHEPVKGAKPAMMDAVRAALSARDSRAHAAATAAAAAAAREAAGAAGEGEGEGGASDEPVAQRLRIDHTYGKSGMTLSRLRTLIGSGRLAEEALPVLKEVCREMRLDNSSSSRADLARFITIKVREDDGAAAGLADAGAPSAQRTAPASQQR